ncbi:MAG: enoyl-CoA hydratase-related protein, partial [Rhodospirillales bacterium]|nr:enoyl-CoA hydratase-related protein [Rhodospirillales bacterium]
RVAGLTRAKDMIMLGRRIPAPEALEWGLLTRVVEDSKAMDKAVDAMVAQLGALSPLALKTVKRVLNSAYETGTQAGLEIEGQGFEKLRDSWDYKEGIRAFLGKRKPRFRGR